MTEDKTLKGAFTLSTAAEYAGVSAPTVLAWVNQPDFPAFRSGRRWVIPRAPFEEWLQRKAQERAQL